MEVYLAFSLLINTAGAVYQLAYSSLYPNLIPKGFAQKGYTVSGMLYPTVIMVMTPVASVLYTSFGLPVICLGEGVLLILAATVETQIRVEETVARGGRFSFRDYLQDFQEGFQYLRREKGLLRVYTYMPLSNGLSSGTANLVTAYFRSTPGLDMTMYAFFTTVELSAAPWEGWSIIGSRSRRKNDFPWPIWCTRPTALWTHCCCGRPIP